VGAIRLTFSLMNSFHPCMQASTIAGEAVDELRGLREEHGSFELEAALFWRALNMATLGANGGWSDLTAELAMKGAEEALQELRSVARDRDAPSCESTARCDFVDAIIHFSRANVILKGIFPGDAADVQKHRQEALRLFSDAYRVWEAEFGEDHPDTIKVSTLLDSKGTSKNFVSSIQSAPQQN
jgi:hypothetical protein